ncbi:PREDICTED: protein GUCD1-like [Priapulus caudatus]|uniref:Protein GUCD1-like n=1 Tax=Priapulus caudatus TaxID=37621 RepID=A0ABM1DVU3_PRICU|nr:PREDICTED: protein GUCD1-like [Priapulus caudatus]XP_014664063.1 PREDICTED: protein GUCD1-like [Priapulus caudatus]XP_014664064.1 PREDICTED: protein GUCD1-like [Priapulus caudatus]XP_014664065.1 PREDICTED: protein GUCD1-like [Priapulus caudatus]
MEDNADKLELSVPHIGQCNSWDCGLACARMVLWYCLPNGNLSDFEYQCNAVGFYQSIWTVDLAYLMRRYGLRHSMHTLTIGVDSGFSKVRFYSSSIQEDEARVTTLFARAAQNGVFVEKREVPLEEVLYQLSMGNPAIVLVNARLLRCVWCNKCTYCFMHYCMRNSYDGHFIVVCGYNKAERLLLYKNPATRDGLCAMTYDSFEEARHSYGTDEDILFVHKPLS